MKTSKIRKIWNLARAMLVFKDKKKEADKKKCRECCKPRIYVD